MNIDVNTFGLICRTCMSGDEEFHSILEMLDNDLRVFEILSKTTPQILIDISDGDKLPKVICKSCLNKLNITYQFQQMLISSDLRMRSLLYVKQNTFAYNNPIEIPLTHSEVLPLQPSMQKKEMPEEENWNAFIDFVKVEITEAEIETYRDTDVSINYLSECNSKRSGARCFQCEICQKNFKKQCLLTNHKRSHSETKICTFCNKAKHTGEKQYLCTQCGKAFATASGLSEHILRHSNEKKFQCPECPSKFSCHSDIAKHMSVHQTSKPYKCDICGSSYTRSYTLLKHKRIHSGERPHKCYQCSMTFITIFNLKRHIRTHTGEKPYKCTICDQAYAQSGDLNKHMRIHKGLKQYKCNQCPEGFKYQAELRKHQISHYKENHSAREISTHTKII